MNTIESAADLATLLSPNVTTSSSARDETFMIFGGTGLVGTQIVRAIARELAPRRIVVCGLAEAELAPFLSEFRTEFPTIEFASAWGNLFVRESLSHAPRRNLIDEESTREMLYDDLFGDIDESFHRSALARSIVEHRPNVLIDCINTATAISYQDNVSLSKRTRDAVERIRDERAGDGARTGDPQVSELLELVETLLISQSAAQLIRHVRLLHRALCLAGTRLYLKVGTTGTGGMGLNIPYTHSEDKPSEQLMAKTAMAFAHTGLLFLMARTPNGPLVKELKPAAMIGYRRVAHQIVRRMGVPQELFASKTESVGDRLELVTDEATWDSRGTLSMAGVDTGENGFFARGEFETITYLDQMEFVTPEEIAQQVVLEIKGSNTGTDVIAGVDSNVISPSYRAGVLRSTALEKLARIEGDTGTHSVAVGQLGPPELSKLLYEAHLLKLTFGTLKAVIDADPDDAAEALFRCVLDNDDLRTTIVSIGIPIVAPDGGSLLRGPRINIPESIYPSVELDAGMLNRWAGKGWVDLRPQNVRRWQDRFERMLSAQHMLSTEGTASISRTTYLHSSIEIGEVVAWIFNNEDGGYRIK